MKHILVITGLFVSVASSTCMAQTHEPIETKTVGTISNDQPVREALVTAPAQGLQFTQDSHETIEMKTHPATTQADNVNRTKASSVTKSKPASTKGIPDSTDDTQVVAVKNKAKVSPTSGAPSSTDEQTNMKTNTNKPLEPVVSGKSSIDD